MLVKIILAEGNGKPNDSSFHGPTGLPVYGSVPVPPQEFHSFFSGRKLVKIRFEVCSISVEKLNICQILSDLILF